MRCPYTMDWVADETTDEGVTACERDGHAMELAHYLDAETDQDPLVAVLRCRRCGAEERELI